MKVFLSSTAQDLDAHRKVAEETIHQLSQQIVAMEYFGALPGTPTEECKRLACESDVVVCIVAHRYGSGITRLEVEAAHNAGKEILVGLLRTIIAGATKERRIYSQIQMSSVIRQRQMKSGSEFKHYSTSKPGFKRHLLSTDLQHLMTWAERWRSPSPTTSGATRLLKSHKTESQSLACL